MKVREIMTSPVVCARANAPIADVATLLANHRISAVPVTDAAGAVIGLVSEYDLLSRRGEVAEDIMSPGIVSVTEDGRGPLAVPVWYHYAPGGEVVFATGDTSRKLRLLRRAVRASLCVQTETAPYLYVSVEGPVTFGAVDFERHTREMAIRYLGAELGEGYLAAVYPDGVTSEVLVRLRPERWASADFRKFPGA